MFHRTRRTLKNGYCQKLAWTAIAALAVLFNFASLPASAADKVENLSSFSFKPAQRDLTAIFVQIAGSLEYYGSPVPYLTHVAREDARIESLYRAEYGKEPQSLRPGYMTDEYLAALAKNWDYLTPKLGLKSLAMDIGREMKASITGTAGEPTIIATILKEHQLHVLDSMSGNGDEQADFDSLKSKILACLNQAQNENHDSASHQPAQPLVDIQQRLETLFKALDDNLPPADAAKVKTALTSMFTDVGIMAQSELKAANIEWALQQTAPAVLQAAQPYSADQETALNPSERQQYAALLSKPHFTKADFGLMQAFYANSYDKLSERGKEELDYRVWSGMRAQPQSQ